ncbi:hypothetical protein ACWEKT_22155 [Nocardia takedensis]|uniref:hypothetical protein n=1 Tax=Nocardia takedensis TaxID=259390 RepID=UPI000592E605|nr:hypothetical protein [Nocardia takedensis]
MTDGLLDSRGYAFARDLRATERLWLSRSVRTILVELAGTLSGLGPRAWARYQAGELEFTQAREFHLALLRVHSVLAEEIEAGMAEAAAAAVDNTADLGDLAAVSGMDRAHTHELWGHRGAGERLALVISQPWPDAAASPLLGPRAGYEYDRRWWPVGTAVRRNAAHVIVVVDQRVRRIYAVDPEGWRSDETGTRWEFTAFGSAPLAPAAVEGAFERGQLPVRVGDHCAARLDRGCAPCYFEAPVPFDLPGSLDVASVADDR